MSAAIPVRKVRVPVRWVTDFFEIDVSLVEPPELDPDWRTTPHGYAREEIEGWVEDLRRIQGLARDRGYGRDDFLRMSTSQDPRERALAETYRHVYEPAHVSAIRVSWDPERQRYEIDNGHARLWAAKRAGLRHLPAFVSAPDGSTLARLRADGERIAGSERPRGYTPVWDRHRDKIEDQRVDRTR
jgi:hypothetical protein